MCASAPRQQRLPVVVDGFIATAAAAAAEKIRPGIHEHLIFSHRSAEGGHALALQAMDVRAMLDLDMRLGEGTGAAIAMNVIECGAGAVPRNGDVRERRRFGEDRMSDSSDDDSASTLLAPKQSRLMTNIRFDASRLRLTPLPVTQPILPGSCAGS